jgi:hypothetical protein
VSYHALGSSQTAALDLDRYLALQQLAELQLELAGRGDIDGLESLGAEWETLTAGLPDQPPPSARPLLERAMLMHERTRVELLRIRDALVSDLSSTGHLARAAHGYSPALDRRPRLDRNA